MNAVLRTELRVLDGREPEPSAAVLDSQSIKTTETPGVRGYDAAKKVKGRNIQDRDGARQVLEKVNGTLSLLILIWADGSYFGQLVDWVKASCGWILEIVKRNDDIKGF
jgi:putative transposase